MNSAHIHLILNHLPIAGMLFSLPLLAVAWWRKSDTLGVAGLVSVVSAGLLTLPTYLTGERAEELIEHMAGVSEKLIKLHEDAATKTIWIIGISAIFALSCLFLRYKNKVLPRFAVSSVLFLSIFSVGLLAWTNNLGGDIRHPELQKDANQSAPLNLEKHEKDDD